MGKVSAGATMSLDGYIAGPNESGFDLLFQWYENGEVEIPSPLDPPVRVTEESAAVIKREWGDTGALLVGRHLFDMMDGWGGSHPMSPRPRRWRAIATSASTVDRWQGSASKRVSSTRSVSS